MNQSLGERLRRWLLVEPERPPRSDRLGGTRIADCRPRELVQVTGTITRLGTNRDRGWFEAELTDSSGAVNLVWMGRTSMSCLHMGLAVTARGRLARREAGELLLYNPEFSVSAD